MLNLLRSAVKLFLYASLASISVSLYAGSGSGTGSTSVSGTGTLSWSYTWYTSTCPTGQVTTYNFTNFVYTATGVHDSLTGSATYIQSPGGQYCPASGPHPSALPLGGSSYGYLLNFNPGANGTGSSGLVGYYGTLNPKFIVLSVIYAPPGAQSYVDYGTSTELGTSTTLSNAFTNSTSVSVTIGGSGIFGSSSQTASTSFTEEQDSSSSVAISKATNYDVRVPGPINSAVGLDHDYDLIFVWLNPKANLLVNNSNVTWSGYTYDSRDPANEMDVVGLYAYWLKNPSSMPASVQSKLARSWDPTGVGGLTTADFATILAQDSFANGGSSIDPKRFDLEGPETFLYEPPPPGGQPFTQNYTETYQTTSTTGRSGSTTYSVGYSKESKLNAFQNMISIDLKDSQTLTWTNKWSSQTTQMQGQTGTLSITGPAYSDNYTGPTSFQVYQDNVYGTFMFNPL